MPDHDSFRLAVQILSHGKNTVLLDNAGLPSVMVRIPVCSSRELADTLDDTIHSAFRINGKTVRSVYISKYPNVILDGRAYSLPVHDPGADVTYDMAIEACRAKGAGWGLVPASLWGAIALKYKRGNFVLHGNNCFGRDALYLNEHGCPTFSEDGIRVCRTATGSGPVSWYHDGTPDGIADLYGNVSEWCAGVRLVHGEIQIIPGADSILSETSLTNDSSCWRALSISGRLVSPGSSDTLKLDFRDGRWCISTTITDSLDDTRFCLFRDMTYSRESLPDGVPAVLKELALFPADAPDSGYGTDYFYANNAQTERILLRGGNWTSGTHAGIFYSAIDAMRTRRLPRLGFRSAYYRWE